MRAVWDPAVNSAELPEWPARVVLPADEPLDLEEARGSMRRTFVSGHGRTDRGRG